ncbi:hypothetical protein [Streptomyces sp. NPDC051569]|uniref:hypothetical protein n=1 Tax=Streptomyces sp. NPDC051569 TaxID=3365661 RepID=UPI003792F6FD
MGDIRINSAGVRGAATDTEALSRQVAKRLANALDGSGDVFGAHYGNGWTSPAHLKVCAEKWEDHIVALARQMGDLSRKLNESADSYDATDAEADARLRTGLNDLGKV